MLADESAVIGVDTHKQTHTAASVKSRTGALAPPLTTLAEPTGYRELLAYADQHAPVPRAWATSRPATTEPASPPSWQSA